MSATPTNKAGEITEEIMILFSTFTKNHIVLNDKSEYNKIYSHVYSVLTKNKI